MTALNPVPDARLVDLWDLPDPVLRVLARSRLRTVADVRRRAAGFATAARAGGMPPGPARAIAELVFDLSLFALDFDLCRAAGELLADQPSEA